MTIAVDTAHCERSFTALKRIKTFLRPTMCEQRLTDLAILSIREISGMLSLDELIYRFTGIDWANVNGGNGKWKRKRNGIGKRKLEMVVIML